MQTWVSKQNTSQPELPSIPGPDQTLSRYQALRDTVMKEFMQREGNPGALGEQDERRTHRTKGGHPKSEDGLWPMTNSKEKKDAQRQFGKFTVGTHPLRWISRKVAVSYLSSPLRSKYWGGSGASTGVCPC